MKKLIKLTDEELHEPVSLNDKTTSEITGRLEALARKAKARNDAIVSGCPETIACLACGSERRLSRELSSRAGCAKYGPCLTCQAKEREAYKRQRLHRAGVPLNLCNATLDNWHPSNEQDEGMVEQVRAFIKANRGFLLLLGGYGTGKSHIAAAIASQFRTPVFVKQSELLRRLRETYTNKAAANPVDQCQDADLLVLDELGLSGGGRDELPMLHDILDHRYNERKPTVLTGNISVEQLHQFIGARMADRLKESAFAILRFDGGTHRHDAREKYFRMED